MSTDASYSVRCCSEITFYCCRTIKNADRRLSVQQRNLADPPAVLAQGFYPTDSFITFAPQKHISREIKLMDAALHNKKGMKWDPLSKRYVPVLGATSKVADGEDGGDDDCKDDNDVPDDVRSANGQENLKEQSAAVILIHQGKIPPSQSLFMARSALQLRATKVRYVGYFISTSAFSCR
jgi:hypothetical protein